MAIIGPPSQALAAIAKANGRILASNDYFTIARSDDAGFVARLYAAGALLVLDAEQAGGCSGLPPSRALVIASEAKQSIVWVKQDLDCFVASLLAMTEASPTTRTSDKTYS